MLTSTPAHGFEDHTAEVRIRIVAPSLAALFEQAGRALAELMLETTGQSTPGPAVPVSLSAPDREALLVDWINELIFLSETRQEVFIEFHIEHVSDTALNGHVRGVAPDVLRTAVKAATFHDLEVTETASGYAARVVVDV